MPTPAKRILLCAAAIFLLVVCVIAFESGAPRGFPADFSITIPKGTTLSETAAFLSAHGLIRSETLFKIYATLMSKATTGVKTGEYLFTGSESAYSLAYRLVKGLEGFALTKVTIPEGVDTKSVAALIAKQAPDFDTAGFVALAQPEEGYLFPETYFWPQNVKTAQVISDMTAQFSRQMASSTVAQAIAKSGRSQSDIVKMAAILEREASSTVDRRIVAGILWKRIDVGMPLQVDSAPETYAHSGLPVRPIVNPGLSAILDAATPTKTAYWYYLSDKHGVMHYASTLEGHAANKNKYL